MTKVIKKLATNNLDSNQLKNNHLSIQLSLDGFSFCTHYIPTHELTSFGQYEFETPISSPYKHLELVEELFKNEPLLEPKYTSVSVCHTNNLVTQVPKIFFDETKLESYLKYTIKVLENDFITFDEISDVEIMNVYIPFVNINNFFIDKFGPFTYKHTSTILIEKLIQEYRNSENDLCFIDTRKNHFDLVVLKNGKLELFNSFSYQTKEDFVYYILFTAEQLHLDTEEFELILLGDISTKNDSYKLLFQYVKNIKLYTPTSFPKLLKDIPAHTNFTLLNQF